MDLFVFTGDPRFAASIDAVVSGFVIDWEHTDKGRRQLGWDTQISSEPRDALRQVRSSVQSTIIVRVNNVAGLLREDIEAAIAGGADEVLVPMVRNADDLRVLIDEYGSSIGVGTMLETPEALRRVPDFDLLPLTRAFIGLNDLAIARQDGVLFRPFLDGTVTSVRAGFRGQLGFGGLTDPEMGHPVPGRVLLRAMVSLGCDFTFLRRSFHRDRQGRDAADVLARIHDAVAHEEARRDSAPAEATADLTLLRAACAHA